MAAKNKDGAYVRSIVAMMNDGVKDPITVSPLRSPSREPESPPRNAPSYLGVARSNNGYNEALLYSSSHRRERSLQRELVQANGGDKTDGTANHTFRTKDIPGHEFVSLSQLIDSKPKTGALSKYSDLGLNLKSPETGSKYSDLGLNLKSPEKNCRSFLRNINSFEKIAQQSSPVKTSPDRKAVTLVGQKMKHLLHLDSGQKDTAVPRSEPVTDSAAQNRITSSQEVTMTDFQSALSTILSSVSSECNQDNLGAPEHDGDFFRKIVEPERTRLIALTTLTDAEIQRNDSIPEEGKGIMRAASGKGKLLIKERFSQFEGLCEENLNPTPGSKITGPGDLAGFWDMVLIEVNSIYSLFREIEALSKSNWAQVPEEAELKPSPTKSRPQSARKGRGNVVKNTAADKAREEARKKKMTELRKLKSQQQRKDNDIEIHIASSK